MNNYKLEITDNKYVRVIFHTEKDTYVVEKENGKWYYQTWDMVGSCLGNLSDDVSEWIDKEYNRLLRKKKLERICR